MPSHCGIGRTGPSPHGVAVMVERKVTQKSLLALLWDPRQTPVCYFGVPSHALVRVAKVAKSEPGTERPRNIVTGPWNF